MGRTTGVRLLEESLPIGDKSFVASTSSSTCARYVTAGSYQLEYTINTMMFGPVQQAGGSRLHHGPSSAMMSTLAALLFVAAGCRPPPTAAPVPDAVDGPAAGSDGRADTARADDDNLIEITGTASRLMLLPGVKGLLISDHGQMPLGRERWKISGYCAVKDTADVLRRIRALGLKARVPLSVAERKRNMQPAPPR